MTDSSAGYPNPPQWQQQPNHAEPYASPATTGYYAQPQGALQPYSSHSPAPLRSGVVLVSAGGRFGAALLDLVLMAVTLWIGWAVWSMFTWSDGQSPAKKLMGHVVADPQTGVPFDWSRMALREFAIKGLLGWVLGICTASIYSWVDAGMCLSENQRTLHDRLASSVVRHI